MELNGDVAVITGGLSGLGLAAATRLAKAGAQAVLLDLPSERGEEVAATFGGSALYAPADITDAEQVRAAFEAARDLGDVRVVVNCAGLGTPGRILGKDGTAMPLATFARVVLVNLVGSFNVLRLGAEFMARTSPAQGERGVIINTASIAGYEGQVGQAAYAASKGGVIGLTLPAARDLAQYLIRVVTVAPGTFDTPMLAGLPEPARASLGAQVPHPSRLGDPDEYAALVEHIVGNPMINGEVIRIDGALRMGPR